jgi:predicted kinase
MDSKNLYILRGCSGSGKSFTANKIFNENPDCAVIYSTDSFWGDTPEEYKKNWADAEQKGIVENLLGMYHKLNIRLTINAMIRSCPIIIIDNTNIKIRDMLPYVKAAEEYGYEVIYQEPESEWWRDWRNNKIDIEKMASLCYLYSEHFVPRDIIMQMLISFQEID